MRYTRQPKARINESILNAWVILAILFILGLGGLVAAKLLPMGILGWYFALSLATFLLYGHDKNAAQNDSWRVQEATLHKLALAGGWVGAAFAHKLLRHKSQKPEFRKNFYMTVIGNIIALVVVWWIKFR